MERIARRQFQGVANIIRFNWHYYLFALVLIVLLLFTRNLLPRVPGTIVWIISMVATSGMLISLTVSWWVYDRSALYSLTWLNDLHIGSDQQLVNIHAGFDETSSILLQKYPDANLLVFDFYDPLKHTEISIERARKAYPDYTGTITINTTNVPLKANSVDYIFLILAAHEIRDNEERVEFFRQLGNALRTEGKIIVVEHQRDIYNFIAYNIGFFHFFSRGTWNQTFSKAGLSKMITFKLTPFLSTFVLTKNGNTA